MDQPEAAPICTLEDVCAEGLRLTQAARDARLPLRLMGGVAVWATCPSAREGVLRRDYQDLDFVSRSRLRPQIVKFFEDQGYQPNRLFNSLHGATRLNFTDLARGRPVDVILDRFAMCHRIDLDARLDGTGPTLSLTDLLLTKLQIVELNRKDLLDLAALLADHELTAGTDGFERSRLTQLTGADWGLEHTIRRTLDRVRGELPGLGLDPAAAGRVQAGIDDLVALLDAAPKSVRWKVRARIGERVRWYELPEAVRRWPAAATPAAAPGTPGRRRSPAAS